MKRTPLALAVPLCMMSAFVSSAVLEEVFVTAQKKEENLTEAPVAVTLVSGETMESFAVFQADELNKLMSGVEIRFEGDSRTGVGIRGVGTFQQQSAPARVGVYLDDYYMASQSAFAFASMFDMGDVQMLKGPQGTLYGQPSPTGALVMATRDPNFDGVSGYVRGSYLADPEGYNLQGAVNIPLVEDQLALRLSGLTDNRETGTENINPVNRLDEERNRDAVRVKLLWEPTDSFQAKLGYTYAESSDSEIYRIVETVGAGRTGHDPEANFPGLSADDRKAISDEPSEVFSRDESFATLHLNWQISDTMELSWFTGYLDSELELRQDNDRTDIPSVVLEQASHYGDDFGSIQHEVRLSGQAADIWEWTVGGYYQDAESQTDVLTQANRPQDGGVFDIIIDIPLESEVRAIFTHNSIALSEDTDLIIGVRYNEFEQTDGTILTGNFGLGSEILPGGEITPPAVVFEGAFPRPDCTVLGGTGTPPCLVGAGTFGWEEWTGTIKLAHHFSDELNAYVTYDRGFRPGAPNFDTTGVFSPDLNNYEGESVDSIEFGAKGDIMEGSGRYTAAFFYSVYEDYQTQAVGLTAFNLTNETVETVSNAPFVNVEEAVQVGIEADIRVQVTDALMVYAGATYSQVEFTAGTVPCTDPSQPAVGPGNRFNSCEADGEIASTQPAFTATAQAEYVFGADVLGGEAYVSGLWAYKGDSETPGDVVGRLDTDAYSTLDLFTGVRSDMWSAQVFIKNVFDEDGVVSRKPVNFGYNELLVVPPQTIGITGTYNF